MSNLDILNLNGTYHLDSNSDSMEELLKVQGMGWAFRKLASKMSNSMDLVIEHTSDKLSLTFKTPVKFVINFFFQFYVNPVHRNKALQVYLDSREQEIYDDDIKATLFVTVTVCVVTHNISIINILLFLFPWYILV